MRHLDAGTIHAWLDGALGADRSSEIERHVGECARCAEAVAEARGLIAASSRILSALDAVPGDVLPAMPVAVPVLSGAGDDLAAKRDRVRRGWGSRAFVGAAAAAALIIAVVQVTTDRSEAGRDSAAPRSGVQSSIADVREEALAAGAALPPAAASADARSVAREAQLAPGDGRAESLLAKEEARSFASAGLTDSLAAEASRVARGIAANPTGDMSATTMRLRVGGVAIPAVAAASRGDSSVGPPVVAVSRDTAVATIAIAPPIPPTVQAPPVAGEPPVSPPVASTATAVVVAAGGGGGGRVGGGGGIGGGGGRAGGGGVAAAAAGGSGRGGAVGGGIAADANVLGSRLAAEQAMPAAGAELVGCYFLAPEDRQRLFAVADSAASLPDRFSIRLDSVAGAPRYAVRTLDSTNVESGIVADLSWRVEGSGVVIVARPAGVGGVVSAGGAAERTVLRIGTVGAGASLMARQGPQMQMAAGVRTEVQAWVAAVPIARIPCTRVGG